MKKSVHVLLIMGKDDIYVFVTATKDLAWKVLHDWVTDFWWEIEARAGPMTGHNMTDIDTYFSYHACEEYEILENELIREVE